MIKKVYIDLLNFAYTKIDVIVISIIFILTNIPVMFWEVYLVGVDWPNEWKVRSVSIVVDIIFASPYVWTRKVLLNKISIKNILLKHYIADTLAILITYVVLKSLKFLVFSQIGWVSISGLSIAIWSIIIFSLFFGRITGMIIDCSHTFIQKKITIFLEKRI